MPKGSDYYPNDVGNTESPKPSGDDAGDDTGQTALLPKSILAGKDFKPGDEVVLKVVHLYDDEVEVEYASGEDEEEKHESKMMKRGPTPNEEIDEMDGMGRGMMKG